MAAVIPVEVGQEITSVNSPRNREQIRALLGGNSFVRIVRSSDSSVWWSLKQKQIFHQGGFNTRATKFFGGEKFWGTVLVMSCEEFRTMEPSSPPKAAPAPPPAPKRKPTRKASRGSPPTRRR